MFHGDAALIQALEATYLSLQNEIEQLREAKELAMIEDHVRENIREKLGASEDSDETA